MIQKKIAATIFILFFTVLNLVFAQSGFNKKVYYEVIASGKPAVLNQQLDLLKRLNGNERSAFEGALLMRKSALLTIPAKRLSMFKQGHRGLEAAISKNPGNVEYRFLRLMIQEHAPKSLGYNKNISSDSKFIKEHFRSEDPVLREAIVNYSKGSKALPSGSL